MNLNEGLPLFELPQVKTPPKAWTVTELTSRIKGVVEPAFPTVWVVGEVSNYRPASSGHVYFSLKDQQACIAAAIFGWAKRSNSFELKDGVQVICRGRVSLFPPRGTYQLIVEEVQLQGAGALQVAFEKLKAKLQAEGLFDRTRKRALPKFPKRLAIVTSPSGAAIQDILNILGRRAPHVRVTIIPAIVQGEGAAPQIIRGLQLAIQHRLGDVVILARGGGSIEDLWCFNDERLARAIAASPLPVVSAVGHEIDFTISDFVSDLRAPTPSAAAEIVTTGWVEASPRVREYMQRLLYVAKKDLELKKTRLAQVLGRLVSPKDRLREQSQRCDEWMLRMERALGAFLERKQSRLHHAMAALDALSPLRVLERGYTIIHDAASGHVIRSAVQLAPKQLLKLRFQDGEAIAEARGPTG